MAKIEEYRKAVRGLYNAFHGDDSLRNPTIEEWAAFAASCSLRDMGTHLCALPTGEYCPKGLVCLGCTHAQPKQNAAPVFRRMLVSHERALRASLVNPRGKLPRGSLRSRGSAMHYDGLKNSRPTSLPQSKAKPEGLLGRGPGPKRSGHLRF